MTIDTTATAELTIQQVSRHTGLAESALRYYERIGLIDPVPRDVSSAHRRYPADLVATIESLSCLRGSGMSVDAEQEIIPTVMALAGRLLDDEAAQRG